MAKFRRDKLIYDPAIAKLRETEQLKADNKAGYGCALVDHHSLYEPIPEPFVLPGFEVSTDSGAHTLYKKFFVQGEQATQYARMNADYSYLETTEFKKFLDDYIQHILEYKELYTFYVTLDIINNPEKSWEITKYIESYGLKPIPVFHNGEDISWLHKMLDGYEYFGISGLGQDITKTKFKSFGDACFSAICDRHGTPTAKVHGFAMGTPEILAQYPWYSADQSTWTYMSRVGSLLLPKPIFNKGKISHFDYLSRYKVLPVTNRRRFEPLHVAHVQSDLTLQWFQTFLEPEGYALEEAMESYHVRDILNIRLFSRIQTAAKKLYAERWNYGQGGNILFAGTPAGASTNLSRLIKLLYDVKIHNMHWLVTPVYKKHLDNCLAVKAATTTHTDYRTLWKEEDTRSKAVPVVIRPRPIKKIKRVSLVAPDKEFEVTIKFKLPILAHNTADAEKKIKLQLASQYPGISVECEYVELTKPLLSNKDATASFENDL